jgi:hypothetical protein
MAKRSKTTQKDAEAIERALAAGQLSVADPSTGYHRSFYADCPKDGQRSAVRRVARSAQAITELTMYCGQCGHTFTAPADSLYLR